MAFTFGVADYSVFILVLIASLAIGLFNGLKGKNRNTTIQFILGGKRMKSIPVALSMMASGESAIMMIGIPAEVYFYSAQYVMFVIAMVLADIFVAFVIVPFIHQLNLRSTTKYFELRFRSPTLKRIASCVMILGYLQYGGVVALASAIAVETGIQMWMSILILTSMAIVYTASGGIRAVIWTDVFQAVVMYIGVLAFVIKVTVEVGGFSYIWDINMKSGRLDIFNFDLDPTTRHTFWSLSLRGIFSSITYSFAQMTVQRISSIEDVNEARRSFLMSTAGYLLILTLGILEGLVMYAYYSKIRCDPMASNQISNINQILPFIVMDVFQGIPGLAGLFISAIICASLSTITTLIGSTAVIIWEDLWKPCVKQVSETRATMYNRLIVIIVGLLTIATAFLMMNIKGPLPQIVKIVNAATDGSVFGVYLIACLCPWINIYGASTGGAISLVLISWITLGQLFSEGVRKTEYLPPAPIDGCFVNKTYGRNITDSFFTYSSNITSLYVNETEHVWDFAVNNSFSQISKPTGLNAMYSLSYLWFVPLSVLTIFVFGSIVSLATGGNSSSDVHKEYVIPVSDWFCCCIQRILPRGYSKTQTDVTDEDGEQKNSAL